MSGRPHPFWFGGGVLLMGVLLAVALVSARPPAPEPATAPENEFSAERALVLAGKMLDDGEPHPVGTQANAEVREVIIGELTELGYTVETQETMGCRVVWATCGFVTNVLTQIPGRQDGPAVLLTAHYDSVPAGPGAADDIAGVAAILEIARILQLEGPYSNPVILLLSDGEEPGLLGAEAFLAEHSWAGDVGVAVNLEASGSGGPSVLFETTGDSSWLLQTYGANAPKPVANSLFDALMQFTSQHTDLNVYEEAGLPAMNFAFVERFAHYHTPLDNLDNLDPASVQHHGDNALASVRAFAEMDLANPPAGSSLVVDALPGALLIWPLTWTPWLALAGLVLLGVVAGVLIRGGQLNLRGLLWGQLVLFLSLILVAAASFGWAFGLSSLTGAPVPWYATPLTMRVAVWTLALLSLVLLVMLFGRRAGF